MPLGAALHRGRPHRTAFCTMVSLVSITRQVDGHNEARHVRSASDSLSYDPARRHPPPPDVTHSADDPGIFTPLTVPGGSQTAAFGINKRGQMVGVYSANNKGVRFLDDRGVFTTLEVPRPGVTFTQAWGINKNGQIVGLYVDTHGFGHGFLYDQGVYTTVDVPFSGAVNTFILGINDRGQIVGQYAESVGGQTHGFVATPNKK
jgi:hypothetical protein